ncbi:MAG: D-alanyl-D-alanine carboxypeptidase family protein [bacterium]|nr:D-alanyl-D-alanine carboxypeptidase family protein [bacterium]
MLKFFKKKKTNRGPIVAIFLFVVFGGAVLTFQHNRLLKEFSSSEPYIRPTPPPMPTELNANFITQVNECFIPVAAVYGYTLRITSGFRTIKEQAELYQQGRTVDGHIVSWAEAGKSIHNYGYAVDVVDRWKGFDINWKRLAKIGQYCALEQVDDPHFEHRGGLSTQQFEMGFTPSPLALPCSLMSERARLGQPLTREDLQDCSTPVF